MADLFAYQIVWFLILIDTQISVALDWGWPALGQT